MQLNQTMLKVIPPAKEQELDFKEQTKYPLFLTQGYKYHAESAPVITSLDLLPCLFDI